MWLLKFKSEFKIILRFLTCPPWVTSAHLEAKNRSESQIRLQDSRWACLLYFFQKARDEQIFEREKDRWSLSNKHSIIIQIIEMPLLLLVKFRAQLILDFWLPTPITGSENCAYWYVGQYTFLQWSLNVVIKHLLWKQDILQFNSKLYLPKSNLLQASFSAL